jgi:mono/diheme cytochrome c family protein
MKSVVRRLARSLIHIYITAILRSRVRMRGAMNRRRRPDHIGKPCRRSDMKQPLPSSLSLGVLVVGITLVAATRHQAEAGTDQLTARGKYLVENVCKCADCHTPMTATGEPDLTRWLMGSTLIFTPKAPIPHWVDAAPAIAGLPGWQDQDAVALLMTGNRPDGTPLNPPMPQFRFAKDDARAVVAYLRSLAR